MMLRSRKVPSSLLPVILALALVLPLVAPVAAIAIPAPKLYGTVTDSVTGQPIAGAFVYAKDALDEWGESYSAYTDSLGQYELQFPAGTFDIEVSRAGYSTQSVSGLVSDGVSAVLRDFSLVQLKRAFFGVVTDSVTGLPVKGADVKAGSVTTKTASDGSYELYTLAGTHEVSASANGYKSSTPVSLTFDGTNPIQQNISVEKYSRAIYGKVTSSADGSPVSGALVDAYDPLTDIGSQAVTAADGTYEIFAPAGKYDMWAYAEGFPLSSISGVTFGGVSAVKKDFTLSAPALAFIGLVTDAASGLPITNAGVQANNLSTGAVFIAKTAADGSYKLNALTGSYGLIAWAPGYETTYVASAAFSGTTVTRDFAMTRYPVAITGAVTDSATGLGLKGATVKSVNVDTGAEYTTQTAADGTYQVFAVAGYYNLTVSADGYAGSSASSVYYDGTAAASQDFPLVRHPRAFHGTVTDMGTGLPVEGAVVTAKNTATGVKTAATAGADGGYEIYAVAGTYDLTVTAEGYPDAGAAAVVFSGSAVQRDFQIEQDVLAFFGTVTDSHSGLSVMGAEVQATDRATSIKYTATTGVGGTYEIYAPAGTYDMTAGADSYAESAAAGVVFGGEDAVQQDFALDDGTAPGATDNAKATYVGSASITITATDSGSGVAEIRYTLDSDDEVVVSGASAVVNVTAVGDHSLSYFAVDNAGNESDVVTKDFTITPAAVVVEPFSGKDRYETTVLASKAAFPSGSTYVVIATGMNWPDALGGASLAGALDAPILLTQTTAVPASVLAEITRLGATKAVIIGGDTAVSAGVESTLKSKLGNANVERIAGSNRYETANMVAARVISLAGGSFSGDAFIATGGNFPDSLAASPIAVAEKRPLYLVQPTATGAPSLPAGVKRVAILGSSGAVNDAVEAGLKSKLGNSNVVRLGGANRYETAALIAGYGVSNAGLSWDGVAVTTGANFPDALGGGVLQGKTGAVMLLSDSKSLSSPTRTALTANRASIHTVRYFGGTGTVAQSVRDAIAAILK